MKVGLIGLGYWGTILLKNLQKHFEFEICTCDTDNEKADFQDYKQLSNSSKIFITTPVKEHNEICRHFLSFGVNVFCEKPLVMSSIEATDLYKLTKNNNCLLFVDWIFTFNNQVNLIKSLVKKQTYGKLKSISMSRQNLGPVRSDVTAKYDLASHDVSIVLYILDELPFRTNWIGYKRNKDSITNDSCHGLMQFHDITVQINASWHYGKKDRLCIFEFEKGFLTWEDNSNKFFINKENLFQEGSPPLLNSINAFMEGHDNQELTINTLKVLEHENSF